MPKIEPAFALYVKMLLAFGVVFQMPTLVFSLARMGMVTAGSCSQLQVRGADHLHPRRRPQPGRRHRLTDDLSGPMLVLYILSIGIAWVFQKRKPTIADA